VRLPVLLLAAAGAAAAADTLPHYYAHPAEADRHGVIAPWYKAQNGQFDYRVRVAAETLKRYPWAAGGRAVMPAPEYVYNGTWSIDHEGRITPVEERDWANGDLGQRAAYLLGSLIEYYRYSGDPAVFSRIQAVADYLVDYCQTPADHGWPRMLISVPTLGKRYGQCVLGPSDVLEKGQGKIQLDIVAEVALELVRAFEMTGNRRWYDAARHWADLLALNRNRTPGAPPWGRYANNASGNGMNGLQTGGVSFLLAFFDELIRTGYTGPDNRIVEAREAGRRYLRDVLLPNWIVDDTWGRNYWDWEDPVQAENVLEYTAHYILDNKDYFPNWRNDVRNIISLFLNHTGVSPRSRGDVYHGAWAYPESSGCCDRSLWYGPLEVSVVFARYGVEAGSDWAREIARRSLILATYDPLPEGQSMDLIDGGAYVNRSWFKIAHPMALKHVLKSMSWLPEVMGPNRENHILRASGVVRRVYYGKGRIAYSTFDAPPNSVDVLRLSFAPAAVTANGKPAKFSVQALPGGDFIVWVRHDGATGVEITGPDPQQEIAPGGDIVRFTGNQVRLIGTVGPNGGLADVFVDDFKQICPIDFQSPVVIDRQVVYYRNGLAPGPHTLRIVPRGKGEARVQAVQYSDAAGSAGFGEGGGPTGAQRMIFGYGSRTDYQDSQGNLWKPATEFVARTGHLTDSVAKTWWTLRQAVFIRNTPDQELYRYGAHWNELTVNLTAGPGDYHLRLKFAETQYDAPNRRAMTIFVNGAKMVEGFDVFATAGAANSAVDLVFNNLKPRNGVIEVRLVGNRVTGGQSEAMIQALELGPGDGGPGAAPKTARFFE
jgi:hypothetical protein